jgi:NADH-quinone oxidoreductase subunit L
MKALYLIVPLAPLAGALVAGLLGRSIGRSGAHWVTILGVLISFIGSVVVLLDVLKGNTFDGNLYTWITVGDVSLHIGFLIDRLSALMMVVVTFVSLLVHIYTIGYMADDTTSPGGYQRFFSYISLFTFSMLMLVMSNNFLQLFFGWEAVGLVSYLLIGFYYAKPTAIFANLKAFLVNRVGDFGFLLGIAIVFGVFHSLHYGTVFQLAPGVADISVEVIPNVPWSLLTLICVLLFIGAMGKSAQVPLHVWLPDSMEGPTPISALIHAATMVTAGIFMVARMSPLFEFSDTARSFVIIIGGITALFMAFIAVVVYDIKRVVAYSTLSQLGYMTVALGASAYPAAMFHLFTHAFFKAALFLAAGSVIIAMHHEQDMRKMGGLWKFMPITYATMLIGGFANAAFPPFAGFFSKDLIIEAAHLASVPGAGFAYFCVLACAFVTALYTFRLIFYAFHGKPRWDSHEAAHDHGHAHDAHGAQGGHGDDHHHGHGGPPKESPAVVTIPLILLAIPSICAGWLVGTIVFGDYFGSAIYVSPEHEGMAEMASEFHGVVAMVTHGFFTLPFWLVFAGIATAFYLYIVNPDLPGRLRERFGFITRILENKYGFDAFNQRVFADGAVGLGKGLWKFGDVTFIDGFFVNGSARLVGWFAKLSRHLQTGYIYTYAFTMIIGVVLLLSLWFSRT